PELGGCLARPCRVACRSAGAVHGHGGRAGVAPPSGCTARARALSSAAALLGLVVLLAAPLGPFTAPEAGLPWRHRLGARTCAGPELGGCLARPCRVACRSAGAVNGLVVRVGGALTTGVPD